MTSYYYYAVYGLRLRSNYPLPGLRPDPKPIPHVTVEFVGVVNRLQGIRHSAPAYHGGPETLWVVDNTAWSLCYGDLDSDYLIVSLSQAGLHITVGWTNPDTMAEAVPVVLAPVLHGSVLAAALHLQGIPCLHASAVALNNGASLLLGPSGSGKSTLAAALLRQGHALLSDDIAVLDFRSDGIWVQPGYPQMRIWPDTARTLGWVPDLLPPTWPQTGPAAKRYLDLSACPGAFCADPRSLHAIYIVEPRRPGRTEPCITPLAPRNALPYLLDNIYAARWLDHDGRIALFQSCARLADLVPVHRVEAPDDLSGLPRLTRLLGEVDIQHYGA